MTQAIATKLSALTTQSRSHRRLAAFVDWIKPELPARIDGQTGFYSVAKLKDIKQAHEAWVRASLPERGRTRTGWIALTLRGDHPLDLGTATEALSPDLILGTPQVLEVPTDTTDWQDVHAAIAAAARPLLADDDTFDRRIAVFPLAPVSACISLGYLFD